MKGFMNLGVISAGFICRRLKVKKDLAAGAAAAKQAAEAPEQAEDAEKQEVP